MLDRIVMERPLHVYANSVIERFVAETHEEAVAIARQHFIEMRYSMDEQDLELEQDPDDKVLNITFDGGPRISRTALEWAALMGKGFLCSTEW